MKVLVISSSHRIGGNSDLLCDQFLIGAQEAGHNVEKINLRHKNISPCFGCYACVKSSKCVQKDDMEEILEKLIDADVIVLATPVYFYSINSQLKTMIDRCLPRYTEINNKKLYYIITSADLEKETMDGTITGLRGYLRCLPDSEEVGIIYGTGTIYKGDILSMPAFKDAYNAGKQIIC